MNHPVDRPSTGPETVRDRSTRLLAACPVVDVPVQDPGLWVAALAVDAIWFGTHTGAYPLDEKAWARICADTARLAGLTVPVRSALSPALHTASLRSPRRPVLDAVLQVAADEGTDRLTIKAVARAGSLSAAGLEAMFGGVQDLLDAAVDEVVLDGFDDLSPLRLGVSAGAVAANLAATEDPRKVTSTYQLMILDGIRPGSLRSGRPRVVTDLVLDDGVPPGLLHAVLALDAITWSRELAWLGYPDALPRAVHEALVRALGEGEP
ncbi:hypothetical protein ACFWFR_18725 [Oerskovia sp. NPDC060287]|uniref:hypothetical protein n=1 Tax=Oerskovia sp. NPDC060287 TaxID=3347095 RepID=UPI00364DD87A